MRVVTTFLLALVAAAVLAGCGDTGNPHGGDTLKTAQPYQSKDSRSGLTAQPSPAAFRRPIATYRRYVTASLGTMLSELDRLQSAIDSGDLAASRAAWLVADRRYESIGAAYGAFGELDAKINGTPAGLPGGIRSKDFTGLHRVEYDLWQRGSTTAAAKPTAELKADVRKLHAQMPQKKIDSLEYALRAHEVLEDSLHLQLAGVASPWSGSALNSLDGNVAGTRVVLASLSPMIKQRNSLVLSQAKSSINRLATEVNSLQHGGRFPEWDQLKLADRERVNGLTAAAAERLAYVPELIDPRPPRPSQLPTGEDT